MHDIGPGQTKRTLRCLIPRCLSIWALIFTAGTLLAATNPTLQQETTLPVNDYRIGPKDLLEITVFEHAELNQTVRVSEDGSITLSLLNRVEVAGLTAQELEKKLISLLEQKYFTTAHVTVFIREYQKVSVLGAVGRPGMYELIGPMTLLQIISQAGGLTSQVSNELYIYRTDKDGKQTTITISLAELNRGNPSLNIELRPRDVVNIPIDQLLSVYVSGQVTHPGAIPFLRSKRITLLQAIAQAGGVTEWARKSGVAIKRKNKETGKEMIIRANLKDIENGRRSDIYLEEGDVVIIP
jgi:polysaccharide export outer membrane protein